MILKKSSKQASHTTSCALRIHEREAGRKTSIADKFNGQTSLNVRKTNTQPSSAHKRTKQENKRSSYISVVNVVLAFDTRDRRRGCYIIPIPVPSVGGTGEGGDENKQNVQSNIAPNKATTDATCTCMDGVKKPAV